MVGLVADEVHDFERHPGGEASQRQNQHPADGLGGPRPAWPTPSTSRPRPTTKMRTRISLATINATVVSTHRRVQATVMSARLPAKARGAKTAVTTMSTWRTISAAHTTTTTTTSAARDSRCLRWEDYVLTRRP